MAWNIHFRLPNILFRKLGNPLLGRIPFVFALVMLSYWGSNPVMMSYMRWPRLSHLGGEEGIHLVWCFNLLDLVSGCLVCSA